MIYAIYNNSQEAIIAQCTPQGNGAIALLRLSGINACTIADMISALPHKKKISSQKTHTIHYGWIIEPDGTHIDQVLFLVMRAPNSFTGDDTIEITCHNNPFIIQNIIQAAVNAGARVAQQGEFSRRAVYNNKIDILQAEAINELIHANTQQTLKQSLSQLKGSFSQWVTSIEKKLITMLALSDASFEFLDEENMEFGIQIKQNAQNILSMIETLKKNFNQQQQIRNGIGVALIGSVNAGKSSLFNALLNQQRSIVTNIAGTTRDSIEAGLYKNNNYWTLIDTAGLRTTHDIIEQMGINQSYQQAHKADIILLIYDGSRLLTEAEKTIYQDIIDKYDDKIIIVVNKTDLPQQNNVTMHNKKIYLCNHHDKKSIMLLEEAIQEKINSSFTTIGSAFLLNQRHYNNILSLEQKLIIIMAMLTQKPSYELISYHINDTLTSLSELTGKTISEAGMDAIFREFCVGK